MPRTFAIVAVIALGAQVAALVAGTRPAIALAGAMTLLPHFLAGMLLARRVAEARRRDWPESRVALLGKFHRKAVMFIFWGGLLVVASVTTADGGRLQTLVMAADVAYHLGAFLAEGALLRAQRDAWVASVPSPRGDGAAVV